jgi:hypothetical protein
MSELTEIPQIKVLTEENELSLEEIAQALPDTPTIMTRFGVCWWHLIYAARGGNWGLTGYYLRQVTKLGNALVMLRPKHADRMTQFQTTVIPPVTAAVEARDLPALEAAYAAATDEGNRMHEASGYPYIRWELPAEPPKGLYLGPMASGDGRVH